MSSREALERLEKAINRISIYIHDQGERDELYFAGEALRAALAAPSAQPGAPWKDADLLTARIIIGQLHEKAPLSTEEQALRLCYLLRSHGLVEFVNEMPRAANQLPYPTP